jgi:hypothetical protein
MQSALKQEMQSREAHLRVVAALPGAVTAAANMFDGLIQVLNVLFGDLEIYANINKAVRLKSASVTDISESLRVSALNGVIAVDKLGEGASGLRPVLDWLRVLSEEITRESVRLSASLEGLVTDVDLVVFRLSAAKLQIEMMAQFAHELGSAARSTYVGGTERAVQILHASSSGTLREALSGLVAIKDSLKTLTASQIRLLEASHSLRPIYLTGKIEMVEGDGLKLASIFEDIGSQMEEATANLNELKLILHDLEAHLSRGLSHAHGVEHTIAQIDSQWIAAATR